MNEIIWIRCIADNDTIKRPEYYPLSERFIISFQHDGKGWTAYDTRGAVHRIAKSEYGYINYLTRTNVTKKNKR